MAESTAVLQSRLEAATVSGYRRRLLDRGVARSLIWRDGVLPHGAPAFQESLTDDLLDYAYAVFAMALRLRDADASAPVLPQAFFVAGEAIEAAVHRGNSERIDRGFHRVSAAVAFHLARFAARAYSVLPTDMSGENLAPTEYALVQLLRRSLDEMHAVIEAWLRDDQHQDARIAQRLREDVAFDEADAINDVIITSFMRGLAFFDHALATGEEASAAESKRLLHITAEAAKDMHVVPHWWTCMMASHLVDDLWGMSLHQRIPSLPPGGDGAEQWNSLRQNYIQRMRTARRATIELWPSQIEAAQRAIDETDDLIVALPTSAGKTRIAELCILRALALNQRAIYVTPLRALSAQVERDLSETFVPLGINVSSLYGSAGIGRGDTDTLRMSKIVVSTPEKLDFALRNDATIIADVGLIVLDEGHMLGPTEREVRFEALVQRLLRRLDSSSRRVVCLSAMFPEPDEMSDLVAWLRQDEPGTVVHSTWRPTRQRFGTVRWETDAARLEITIEGGGPFVPRFVESRVPPTGSRRRVTFPHDKNELTLATAWQFVAQEKDVLIYCALRRSVETLGRLIIQCIRQGVLHPLRSPDQQIDEALATGEEWLGPDHPAVECLRYGIALHHGQLPRPFLNDIEQILHSRACPLTIASPTLAQGLNLSASVLLVPSLWRNRTIIPTAEFANVAGRAGRAFVDVEGLVLHIVWEQQRTREQRDLRLWDGLVADMRAPQILSGLLQLAHRIFERISFAAGVPVGEIIEYITGHDDSWDFNDSIANGFAVTQSDWERDVASLDAALLALLDTNSENARLEPELELALEGSLFSRQLSNLAQNIQVLLSGLIAARARYIWTKTTLLQRKGYHVAGVGFQAGQYLDANISILIALLLRSEAAIVNGDKSEAANAAIEFAHLVFQIAPFAPVRSLPDDWQAALHGWIEGRRASDILGTGTENNITDLLGDTLSYRLPWAMEAVRVHGAALGQDGADGITGLAAMAVEVGSANRSVIALLRAGLNSREAALAAVVTSDATFVDRAGMDEWLRSQQVELLTSTENWPTIHSRHSWLHFYDKWKTGDRVVWTRDNVEIGVDWVGDLPEAGDQVVVELLTGVVLTPDLIKLGVLQSNPTQSRHRYLNARVGDHIESVIVEYFEPPPD